MKKTKAKLRQAVLASLLTAMITVLTCYIKIPMQNGYMHIGDSIIYIAACLLPAPLAVFCGAVGGALSDIVGGYTIYALPSLIIKALIVLPFDRKKTQILSKRNILACLLGAVITVVGYYLTEVIIVASAENILSPVPWTTALPTVPGNLIQAVVSTGIFSAVAIALDKASIKQKITKLS